MVIVLYTTDFEPITTVDLPMWIIEHLEQVGPVRIAVVEPDSGYTPGTRLAPKDTRDMETVVLRCETIPWFDGTLKSVMVVEDDALALALKCDWLPGQRQAVNYYLEEIRDLGRRLVRALKRRT